MTIFNKYVIQYLKWTTPIALIAAILSGLGKSGDNLFYDITGWVTIFWIILLIYMVFMTSLSPQLRESFVRWLSRIEENDERETQITGLISKKTFIFMTGILTLLLFLSVLRIDIYQNKDLIAQGKKGGMVTFGMGLRFIESDDTSKVDESNRDYIIKYHGLPLASDGTLILVILLQMGAFYFFSKKETQITSS